MNTLIKNGFLLRGGRLKKLDVYIEGSTVSRIGENLTVNADREVNAEGLVVLPGFVDMHCHLREPEIGRASCRERV